jgi:hypothetical protein
MKKYSPLWFLTERSYWVLTWDFSNSSSLFENSSMYGVVLACKMIQKLLKEVEPSGTP